MAAFRLVKPTNLPIKPANLCHRCGFVKGCNLQTCTHTPITHTHDIPYSSMFAVPLTCSRTSLSFSGATTEDISVRTRWTVILTMCRKHIILWSFASSDIISRSRNSFCNSSSIVSLVVRLLRVQWPDCMKLSYQ